MSVLAAAVTLYQSKFGDVPTISGLGEDAERKAATALIRAIQSNKPFKDDAEFYKTIGIDPPEDDMVI